MNNEAEAMVKNHFANSLFALKFRKKFVKIQPINGFALLCNTQFHQICKNQTFNNIISKKIIYKHWIYAKYLPLINKKKRKQTKSKFLIMNFENTDNFIDEIEICRMCINSSGTDSKYYSITTTIQQQIQDLLTITVILEFIKTARPKNVP